MPKLSDRIPPALVKGFHLEQKEEDGTTRPCMKGYDAVAIPIFHSRREAWKFLRGWSGSLTTKQLRGKRYRCLEVEVLHCE